MSVNLYDLFDVAPDASAEDVRAAWKAAIADLDPGDRRFRAYNAAAEVLLDPERRAAHDADLDDADLDDADLDDAGLDDAAPADEPVSAPVAATPPAATADDPPVEEVVEEVPEASEHTATPDPRTVEPLSVESKAAPGGGVPTWVLAAAGVVTAAVVAATAWAWTSAGDDGSGVGEQGVEEAVSVAEEAAVPMLSFDYRDLDQGIVSAESFMTPDYAAKHSLLINDLRDDIVAQQTVVDAQVMGSAVTRTTAAGVDVLVLVNQVTQRATGEPFLLPVWATVQMVEQDGTWRVDNLVNRGAVSEEPSEEPSDEPSDGASDGASSPAPVDPSAEPTP